MKGGVIRANDVMEVIVHVRHHTQEKILVKKFLIGMTQPHTLVGVTQSKGTTKEPTGPIVTFWPWVPWVPWEFNVLTFRCTKSISQLYCYIELSEG